MYRRILTVLVAAGALAACDDGTGVDDAATVGIAFATTPTTSSAAGSPASLATEAPAPSIAVAGSNGTLTIDEIHVIVAEFELEGANADFEAPPSLVRIPTDGTAHEVASAAVPLGTYTELEWEVEDVELDGDDDEEEIEAVRTQIETAFGPGVWPAEASMVVRGSFLPQGATTATPFTTFFGAEIEVEMDLQPPLILDDEGENRQLTILLSPDAWFRNADGTVMDLAARSGELVEFEAEFENGVMDVEIDIDDD